MHHDTANDERTAALARTIAARLRMCSHDELRVVDVILERIMKVGRESYLPLDLARDDRDWSKEAADEFADALFYMAAHQVATSDRRLERLRCEAADELVAYTEPACRACGQAIDAGVGFHANRDGTWHLGCLPTASDAG